MLRSPVILLTACIDPGQTISVARNEVSQRLDDYRRSLRAWSEEESATKIVFCENSLHDLAPLKSLITPSMLRARQFEFLSFNGQSFPIHLGKGYGELNILRHAIKHSELINDDALIMKVTGRLFVSNLARFLSLLSISKPCEVWCDLRGNLTWADSRLFVCTTSFLSQYLLPLQKDVNDSRGYSLEHILSRAVHLAMANGMHWSPLPLTPAIQGISGTSNVRYPDSLFRWLRREIFRRIKAAAIAR